MKFQFKNFLLTLSFLEGMSLMAWEVLAAKIISPYFGNTVMVWASMLGMTLFGIALGYFFGGMISKKSVGQKSLVVSLVCMVGFSLIIFFTKEGFLNLLLPLSSEAGSFLAMFLFLPLFISFGAFSPLLVKVLSCSGFPENRAAGTVFAVSTFGGIVGTLFTGFVIIRYFSISWGCVFYTMLLGSACICFLFQRRRIQPPEKSR